MVLNGTITTRPGFPPDAVAGPMQDFQTDSVTIPVKLCNLPPFSSVAQQVLALSADPDIDLPRIAAGIEADPAFAAEVLFLANSSLFGFPSRMHILRHGVAILGLDRIRALAVTVAMRAFLGAGNPLIRRCWQHSAACACICEEIAAVYDFSGDRAYTVGLIHDIGRLGFLKSYAKEYEPVMTAEHPSTMEVLKAERAALNVDHAVAGSWLAKNWAFPQEFCDICARHHEPLYREDPELLQLVKTACRTADALGFSAVKCTTPPSYDEVLSSLPHQIRRKGLPAKDELRRNVEKRLAAFEH